MDFKNGGRPLYNSSIYNLGTEVFTVGCMQDFITPEDTYRLNNYRRAWNFYEGYHWEEVQNLDKPEVTENYCKPFVNKFVAFELGDGFTIQYKKNKDLERVKVTEDQTVIEYLESVWEDSGAGKLLTELGQSKSITGDGWLRIRYQESNKDYDLFNEHEKGQVLINVVPTGIVFPEYDTHDRDRLVKLTIMYPIDRPATPKLKLFSKKRSESEKVAYRQVWTSSEVVEYIGNEQKKSTPNKYGFIPFVQIKNFPIAGKETGIGDLEDLIPMNMELDLKKSDISEIIDYHSAPVTVVYGASTSNLEKGANKIWGGLPSDSRVENLRLEGDLTAADNYTEGLKRAMHEVGGVPQGALGGEQAISNTSGVALHFANLPLIDRTKVKVACTSKGVQLACKMILHIARAESIIQIPEKYTKVTHVRDSEGNLNRIEEESTLTNKLLYSFDVTINNTLPKDDMIELQTLAQEMTLGLESTEGGMRRRGVSNIEDKIEEVEKDMERKLKYQDIERQQSLEPTINSGFMNGSTPIEMVRKEMTGQNGGGTIE